MNYQFRGIVTFCSGDTLTEYMCLYTADEFEGEITSCNEGVLEWVDKDKLTTLNLWDGDVLFLDLLRRKIPFFSLKLSYKEDGSWYQAVLNGKELELFDICDDKGMPTGHVKERTMVHKDGDMHRTVHVWIIQRRQDGGVDVLLQKRSTNKDSYPGCYDISSAGHMHAGDAFEDSALRELEEELGIKADNADFRFIGFHQGYFEEDFWGERFIDREVSAVYLYEKPVELTQLSLQASEVDEVKLMDYDKVCEDIKSGILPNCIYPEEFAMIKRALEPGFDAQDVWVKEDSASANWNK